MKHNRDQVIAWIGLSEGGLSNHTDDNGGLTNKGITQRTYSAWLKSKGQKGRSVRHITKAEADTIVADQYMDPVKFDQLPEGLDYSVADFSVNSGPARAAKELQSALGMTGSAVDGLIGAQTLAAVEKADLETLIKYYNARRMRYLQGLSDHGVFGKGWKARVMGNQDGFQAKDIGVSDRSVMMARGRTNIPAPSHHDTPKTTDEQITETTLLSKVLQDPVAYVPVLGTLGTLFSGDGPVQFALAGVVLIGAAYLAVRMLRKSV